MATVDKRIAGAVIAEVRRLSTPNQRIIEGESYLLYNFNELQATFLQGSRGEEFFGFIFSLFGNEVLLSGDLVLMTYDEETDQGVSIEDENFIKVVNQFLALRLKSMRDFRF